MVGYWPTMVVTDNGELGIWIENLQERASLVPAAAVIPAFQVHKMIVVVKKLEQTGAFVSLLIIIYAPSRKRKSFGSGGSMVAKLKLKGIDGRAPPGVEPAA
ncbi:Hypothetical protein SRAE_0000068233 [Strongyloides ratti]|uniref:Uncharacterized protein n=1 Tax=Strongyloides ratti TaxID=34506 RepID=A0A090MTB3_STRRB|nr:Hypothetical protein SRAE_0000068233 [Strongyloides ratti]CEF61563.1 Hypothetical protein SRAE_0000068233 [Strongyloides ratti]